MDIEIVINSNIKEGVGLPTPSMSALRTHHNTIGGGGVDIPDSLPNVVVGKNIPLGGYSNAIWTNVGWIFQ